MSVISWGPQGNHHRCGYVVNIDMTMSVTWVWAFLISRTLPSLSSRQLASNSALVLVDFTLPSLLCFQTESRVEVIVQTRASSIFGSISICMVSTWCRVASTCSLWSRSRRRVGRPWLPLQLPRECRKVSGTL